VPLSRPATTNLRPDSPMPESSSAVSLPYLRISPIGIRLVVCERLTPSRPPPLAAQTIPLGELGTPRRRRRRRRRRPCLSPPPSLSGLITAQIFDCLPRRPGFLHEETPIYRAFLGARRAPKLTASLMPQWRGREQ
jgi:hypothetical protein